MDSETSAAMVHVFEAEVATLHAVGKGMTAGRSSLTIVFDLASVDYVASAFMRLCLIAVRKAGKGGFSIINATPFVQEMLHMAGLDKVANIGAILHETRQFPPPADFAAKARVSSLDAYRKLYREALLNLVK